MKILVEELVWKKISALAREANGEMSCFGRVSLNEGVPTITDVRLLEQKSGSAITHLSIVSYEALLEEELQEKLSNGMSEGELDTDWRCWIHSHPGTGVPTYSSQDDTQINELADQTVGSANPYVLGIVLSSDGKNAKGYVCVRAPIKGYFTADVVTVEDVDLAQWAKDELAKYRKEQPPTTNTKQGILTPWGFGSGFGDYLGLVGGHSNGGGGKKKGRKKNKQNKADLLPLDIVLLGEEWQYRFASNLHMKGSELVTLYTADSADLRPLEGALREVTPSMRGRKWASIHLPIMPWLDLFPESGAVVCYDHPRGPTLKRPYSEGMEFLKASGDEGEPIILDGIEWTCCPCGRDGYVCDIEGSEIKAALCLGCCQPTTKCSCPNVSFTQSEYNSYMMERLLTHTTA